MRQRTNEHLSKTHRQREPTKLVYQTIDNDLKGRRTPAVLALLKTDIHDLPFICFCEPVFSQLFGVYAPRYDTGALRSRASYKTSGIITDFLPANVSNCLQEGDLDPNVAAELFKHRSEQWKQHKKEWYESRHTLYAPIVIPISASGEAGRMRPIKDYSMLGLLWVFREIR